ncbi:glycosyltransferase family 4 protein [Vibrio sp. WXL210]|uniref:glycosyltransferase family 4 protein n=1 Tax=Vibrio sp. WXL210 TaxID=3450709 RepID=UPI003EC6F383
MRQTINLMVGTDWTGQGGIATVVSIYQEEGLLSKHNFRYVASHSSRNTTKLQALWTHMRCLLTITAYALRYNIGLIHVHMASRGSYMRKAQVVRLGKWLGARVIIHLHGGGFKDFFDKCPPRKQARIRETFNLADKVIVLSTQWLKWVQTLLNDSDKAALVHNAVPQVEIPPVPCETINILFLGRLCGYKGTGDLLRAFAQVAPQFPTSRLALGGDGDINGYQELADKLGINDQVMFLGWIAGKEKSDWMARSSIYVLPSYKEGFPMGILEAMCAKIPVISSTVGGIPDAITNNQDGLLVQAGDTDGLANALKALLASEALRNRISQQAYQKYCNNFSPSVVMPKIEKIYQELLSL